MLAVARAGDVPATGRRVDQERGRQKRQKATHGIRTFLERLPGSSFRPVGIIGVNLRPRPFAALTETRKVGSLSTVRESPQPGEPRTDYPINAVDG